MMLMNCKIFESLLADAIGGELGEADRAAFESHAESCAECRREFRSLSSTLNLVRNQIGSDDTSLVRQTDHGMARQRSPIVPAVIRYAAAIGLAFLAGYGLGGIGARRSAGAPEKSVADVRAITVHEQLAVTYRRLPEASMFAKSMLAVLGPPTRGSR